MIKRYEIEPGTSLSISVTEDNIFGDWVLWEDIETMISRLKEIAENPCLAADANGAQIDNILAGRDRDDNGEDNS